MNYQNVNDMEQSSLVVLVQEEMALDEQLSFVAQCFDLSVTVSQYARRFLECEHNRTHVNGQQAK
jgi:predicted component of type VI protein secretion system